jgi:hypothetical protein
MIALRGILSLSGWVWKSGERQKEEYLTDWVTEEAGKFIESNMNCQKLKLKAKE